MRMRKVGNTDLMVSEICLGTGSFGGVGMYRMSGNIQQEEANSELSLSPPFSHLYIVIIVSIPRS